MADPVIDDPLDEVRAVLEICGIEDAGICERIIQHEGFASLADLGEMDNDTDVSDMAKRMASRTAAEGRVNLGTVQIKKLQALVWWVKDQQKRGLELRANKFGAAELELAKNNKRVERERDDTGASIKDLSKFDPDDFDVHEDAFLNLLALTIGAQKEPLRYVVREEIAPEQFVDENERRMYQIRIDNSAFEEDNRKVYRLLKSFLINTAGWAWIERYNSTEDGRKAFRAWTEHYNGQGELSKRTSLAKARIKGLHYQNERSMSFEKYTKLLTKAFMTLEKDPDESFSERQKVNKLLEGIQSSDIELQSCKAVITSQYAGDFTGACAYFSQQVSRLHGGAQLEEQKFKRRRISQVDTCGGRVDHGGRGGRGRFRGGHRGGRGGGRSGRGGCIGGRRTIINGVDVSDPFRTFSGDEWEQLRYNGGRDYVNNARQRSGNHSRGAQGRGRDGQNGRGGQRIVSEVETNRQQQNQDDGNDNEQSTRGHGDRGGRNGRGFGRGAYSSGQF
jgi:hypothetical protein